MDMIKETHIISDTEMCDDSTKRHVIVSLKVAADDFKHAWIMYSSSGGTNAALINADVFFTGTTYVTTEDVPDRVFVKNAKVIDIRRQMIGYD